MAFSPQWSFLTITAHRQSNSVVERPSPWPLSGTSHSMTNSSLDHLVTAFCTMTRRSWSYRDGAIKYLGTGLMKTTPLLSAQTRQTQLPATGTHPEWQALKTGSMPDILQPLRPNQGLRAAIALRPSCGRAERENTRENKMVAGPHRNMWGRQLAGTLLHGTRKSPAWRGRSSPSMHHR